MYRKTTTTEQSSRSVHPHSSSVLHWNALSTSSTRIHLLFSFTGPRVSSAAREIRPCFIFDREKNSANLQPPPGFAGSLNKSFTTLISPKAFPSCFVNAEGTFSPRATASHKRVHCIVYPPAYFMNIRRIKSPPDGTSEPKHPSPSGFQVGLQKTFNDFMHPLNTRTSAVLL